MLKSNLEELLVEVGCTQGHIWEIKYLLDGPSPDYTRLYTPSLCLYIFKDNPRYLYFIPLTHPAYRGTINRVSVTNLINEMPRHILEDPEVHPLLEKGLRLLSLPKGFIYHTCCSLNLIDTLYMGGPELYAGWNGGEFITFINTSNWDMKTLHLDTLVSLRDYLPKDINELLLNLIQCRLPLPPSS